VTTAGNHNHPIGPLPEKKSAMKTHANPHSDPLIGGAVGLASPKRHPRPPVQVVIAY
jgi:hypothetical protein